jgi:hypothetical protein
MEDRQMVKIMFVTSGNIRKVISATVLALLSVFHIQPLRGGEIVFNVEEPRAGSVMTGVSNIRGWAVGSSGIDRIELYIDGEFKTEIPFGGSRKDVGRSYPEFPDSDNSGFSMANNYNLKSAAPHVITIKVFDNDGAMEETDVSYTVTRFEDPFISNPADINILEITDILINSGRSLTMKGADVQGEKQDIRLDWQTPKQNFSMTSILPSDEGVNASLDGVYSLSRLTIWFGKALDIPDGLILDTEAPSTTADGVTFRMTASGTATINGSETFTSVTLTLFADGGSETIQEEEEGTITADDGWAVSFGNGIGEIVVSVLLQRGTHLIVMDHFYDEPDNNNGAWVEQWQKIAESATEGATIQQFSQPSRNVATDVAYPSMRSAISQSVRNLLYNADQ